MIKRTLLLALGILLALVIKIILEPEIGDGRADEHERLTDNLPPDWSRG